VEPPDTRGLTAISIFYGKLHAITYHATLDVSRELVPHVARLLWAEHRQRATPKGSRALTCF
jgi:hypothetical protein